MLDYRVNKKRTLPHMPPELRIDEIGYWSEIKLAILEEYARPYNQILLANNFFPIYIDGFAGAGHHLAKGSERLIEGSPVRALAVLPPFQALHLIDLDAARATRLEEIFSDNPRVTVYRGDCNDVLRDEVFPKVKYADRQRALCILDPYGLHLDWETIKLAAESKAIEIFLNFPVMDMNRNVFWRDFERVLPAHQERMTRFWGDETWKRAAYQTSAGLFELMQERTTNDELAEAFRARLKEVAGFRFVPKPMPMRNKRGAIVYYLFFASQNATAEKIVKDIFAKYLHRGELNHG